VLTNAEAREEELCEEERYRYLPKDQQSNVLLYEGAQAPTVPFSDRDSCVAKSPHPSM
jgi:hypothetical protein